jgi:Choline/ethanolamine kinase
VLALFGNGRVEEWLHCAGLSPVDMCDARFVPRIAALLARFHSLDVPLPRDRHTPFAVIYDWLRQARTLSFEDEAKQV